MKYKKISSPHKAAEEREGSLEDFVAEIPYVLGIPPVLPPLHILNDLFQRGGMGGDMGPGVEWEPFAISKDEYGNLLFRLEKKYKIHAIQVPDFVHSLEDWQHFLQFRDDLDAAKQVIDLDRQERALWERYQSAEAEGDSATASELYKQYLEVNSWLNRLVKEKAG